MSKISERLLEKKRLEKLDKAFNKAFHQYFIEKQEMALDVLAQTKDDKEKALMEMTINTWHKDIKEKRVITIDGISIKVEDIIKNIKKEGLLEQCYEQLQLKLLADKEQVLMNEDIIKVVKNKTEPKKEKRKGV